VPTIVHFEIPSDDIERSRNFYNDLFGWNIEKWTGSMPTTAEGMEYWLLSTVDDKGNKATTGGMMKRRSPQQQGITNYFDVKSVQEYSAKVDQLGGKVISPKQSVPGVGYIAVCTDTEDNTFGIFEADQTAK
jgi:uncharacterized protein